MDEMLGYRIKFIVFLVLLVCSVAYAGGCSGIQYNRFCWFMGGEGDSCTDVCEERGGVDSRCWDDDSSCNVAKQFVACESCGSFSYWGPSVWYGNQCYFRGVGCPDPDASHEDRAPLCACTFSTTTSTTSSTLITTSTLPQPNITNTSLVISGIRVRNITSCNATVVWGTNESADSTVNYGNETPWNITSNTSFTRNHSMVLADLKPETTYYFSVLSTDPGGNTAVGDNGGRYYRFTTASTAPAPSVKVHYCDSCGDCSSKIQSASPGDAVCLTGDIDHVAGTCIDFGGADNITFDCQGRFIKGDDDFSGDGIHLEGSDYNIVRNCDVSLFGEGIRLYLSDYNTLTGNTVNFNRFEGIRFESSSRNTLAGNTVNSNSVYGFFLSYSWYNTFSKNTVCSNEIDFHICEESGNSGDENICDKSEGWNDEGTTGCSYPCSSIQPPVISDVQVEDVSRSTARITWKTNKLSNSTVNYGLTTTLGETSSNPSPTTLHSVTLTNLEPETTYYFEVSSADTAGNIAVDNNGGSYYNLTTTPIPVTYCNSCEDCSNKIQSAAAGGIVHLAENIDNVSGTCIDFGGADNITFNCQGRFIKGDDDLSGYGIHLNGSDNNIVRNCDVSLFGWGIRFDSSSGNTLTGNTANSNRWEGIRLDSSSRNTLTGNTVNSNRVDGIRLYRSSYNTFSKNTVCSNNEFDFRILEGSGNSGDENICDWSHELNDEGTAGCSYPCLYIQPPVISDVQIKYVTGSTAGITWKTNKLSNSTVNYGVTASLGNTSSNSALTTRHSITLTNLEPETTYYFEVSSADTFGEATDDNGGNYYNFTTTLMSLATYCNSCEDCSNKIQSAAPGDAVYLAENIRTRLKPGGIGVIARRTCIDFGGANNITFDCQGRSIRGLELGDSQGIQLKGSDNNIVRSCDVSLFGNGIYVSSSSGNTLTDNIVSVNWRGIYLTESSDNILTGNSVSINWQGIYLSQSRYNILSGNTVCSNDGFDFHIDGGSGNSGDENTCDRLFGWNDKGTAGCSYSCFSREPPLISDVQVEGTPVDTARITWKTNKLSNSTVNYGVTTGLGDRSSNSALTTHHSITLTNLEPETTYYFEVSSADTAGNTAADNKGGSYYNFTTIVTPPAVYCNSCKNCSSKIKSASPGGTVYLTEDIYNSNEGGIEPRVTCIDFGGADDITFDCQGHSIVGDGDWHGNGIYLSKTGDGSNNNIIRDCSISLFRHGVIIVSSHGNTLIGNTINSSVINGVHIGYRDGLYVGSSSNANTLINNTITYNQRGGVYVHKSSDNVLSGNTICSNGKYDIRVSGKSGNSGGENTCDSLSGWNDIGTSGCTYPCVLNELCKKYSSEIHSASFGDTVYLTEDIDNVVGTCINFGGANNITFDCQGRFIRGDGDQFGYGIYLGGSESNIVRNCNVSLFNVGGFLHHSSRNTFINNTLNSNKKYGISLHYSKYNIFSENTVCSNNGFDFHIVEGSGNSGDENTCDRPSGWNDTGSVGCTHACVSNELCNKYSSEIHSASFGDTVYLTEDIDNVVGTCIDFSGANNITFDCQGRFIRGDGDQFGYGIYLGGSESNIVRNCNVSLFRVGGFLHYSSNNTLDGNIISNNKYSGIRLHSSSGNTLTGNTVTFNKEYGISLGDSAYNTLSGNTVNSNEEYGINLGDSAYNTLSENTVTFNKESGINLDSSAYNTLSGNTVNSNEKNAVSGMIFIDSGGICLCNSAYNTLSGNTVNYNSIGINLYESNNCTLSGNIACLNNYADFYIYGSGNSGDENTCGGPLGWDDIGTTDCTYPCVLNEACKKYSSEIQSASPGDTVYLAEDIDNVAGTCINFGGANNITFDCQGRFIRGDGKLFGDGIYLKDSDNNIVRNCNVSLFGLGGFLHYSSNNTLDDNIISNNDYGGIRLYSSSGSTLTRNTVNFNKGYGISLAGSAYSTLTGNTVNSNEKYGISLSNSAYSILSGNTVNSNKEYGISLGKSSNATLTGNTVDSNGKYGIRLIESSSSILMDNTVDSNEGYGINLNFCFNNIFSGNSVGINKGGILFESSGGNTLTGNTVDSNKEYGVFFGFSSNNVLSGNTICSNGLGDFYLSYVTDNHNMGYGNTCGNPGGWVDEGTGGCGYDCDGNPAERCGNNVCGSGENCQSCPLDCPPDDIAAVPAVQRDCSVLNEVSGDNFFCCPDAGNSGMYGCANLVTGRQEGESCTCDPECAGGLVCTSPVGDGHCCPAGETWNGTVCGLSGNVLIVALKANLKNVYSKEQITNLEDKIDEFIEALAADGLSASFFYLDEDMTADVAPSGVKVNNPHDWTDIDAVLNVLIPKMKSEYLIIIGGYANFPQTSVGSKEGSDDPYGDIDGDGNYVLDLPVGRMPAPNDGDIDVILNALDTAIDLHRAGGIVLETHASPIMSCGGYDGVGWRDSCICPAVFGTLPCSADCGCLNYTAMGGKDFVIVSAHGPGPSQYDALLGGCIDPLINVSHINSLDVSDALWMSNACGGGHLRLKKSTSGSIAMTFLKNGGAVFLGSSETNFGLVDNGVRGCFVPGGDCCCDSLYTEVAARSRVGVRIGDAYMEGKNEYFNYPSAHGCSCKGGHIYQYHINYLMGDPTLKIRSIWW